MRLAPTDLRAAEIAPRSPRTCMRCGLFASRRVSSSSRALLGSTLALASLQRTMSTAIKLNDGRLHPQMRLRHLQGGLRGGVRCRGRRAAAGGRERGRLRGGGARAGLPLPRLRRVLRQRGGGRRGDRQVDVRRSACSSSRPRCGRRRSTRGRRRCRRSSSRRCATCAPTTSTCTASTGRCRGSVAAYQQLEKAQQAGLVRSLGVSNYAVEDFQELMASATVTPAINQIEINPFLYRKNTIGFFESQGVKLHRTARSATARRSTTRRSSASRRSTGAAPRRSSGGGACRRGSSTSRSR